MFALKLHSRSPGSAWKLLQRASLGSRAPTVQETLAKLGGEDKPRKRTPRRTLLYLPGTDERKAAKAATLKTDIVCLDCEDAVASGQKDSARQTIIQSLQNHKFEAREIAVRINAVDTDLALDDLKAILTAPVLPSTLVVPKIETKQQIEWLFESAWRICKSLDALPQLRLITQVEGPMGLLNLHSICQADRDELSQSTIFTHDGIIVGGDDMAAALGATRSKSNEELLYARQHTVAVARAYDLDAIDIVNINFREPELLKAEAEQGAAWGFAGKQIIHPNQIEVVQRAFSPSEAQIAYASRVLAAFEAANADGRGAFDLDGQMIDMPTVLQCQNVMQMAQADNNKDSESMEQHSV